MLNLGYSEAQRKAYETLLSQNHLVRISVQILDLNHKYLQDVSSRLLEGQVDVDMDGEVTRSLTLSLEDPKSMLDSTSTNPDEGALFMDRMIRVVYSIGTVTGDIWYDIPIFTGPIVKLDRTEGAVSIQASGKEFLMFSSVWSPATYKKGQAKTNVIKDLFRDYGEKYYVVPDYKSSLPKDLAVDYDSVPWQVIQKLATAVKCFAYYDARGMGRVRGHGSNPVFIFDESRVTTNPQFGYSTEGLVNAVRVTGGVPKGAKKKVHYATFAPQTHPLSPAALGRFASDGKFKPRYYLARIDDESIKSVAEAREVAEARLNAGLLENIEASFEAVVVPHLEVNDLVRVQVGSLSATVRMRKFSIPLTGKPVASYGFNKRMNPSKAKIRRNKK